MFLSTLLILLGAALLYAGGEALVKYSSQLARLWGAPPLVIGLTIVAFGTSSPELAASITAALKSAPEIALGNVIGSNIANLGLIAALCSIIVPLQTRRRFIVRETPIMILASAIVLPLMWNDTIGRVEGLTLFVLALAYFIWMARQSGEEEELNSNNESSLDAQAGGGLPIALLGVAIGIVLLTGGAYILVEGATQLARGLGVSERVIGLKVVAIGTSLPELASCVVAAFRRQVDFILGNLIGSNILNIVCILGATAAVHPLHVAWLSLWVDYVCMMLFSAVIWVFLTTGLRLVRWEGGVLLTCYMLYVGYLFMAGG